MSGLSISGVCQSIGILLCRLWKAKDEGEGTEFDVHLTTLDEETVAVDVWGDHYFIGLNAYKGNIENQPRYDNKRGNVTRKG